MRTQQQKITQLTRGASKNARKAIEVLYGVDLLAHHKPKSIDSLNLNDFELILTMNQRLTRDLPREKTYTLKEYAGLKGEIVDPYGESLDRYVECRDEIKNCLDRIMERISQKRI